MSHDRPPGEPLFEGLAPPGPPEDLRGKALALAREALEQEAVRDVWTRIWESRSLRLAWAVAAALLVLANVGWSVRRPTALEAASRTGSGAEREAARELVTVVAVAPIDENVQPLVGRAEADGTPSGVGTTFPRGGSS